jgi:hypothetical protein
MAGADKGRRLLSGGSRVGRGEDSLAGPDGQAASGGVMVMVAPGLSFCSCRSR